MVDYINRLYVWFKQPWPLHLLPIFIITHLVGLRLFSSNVDGWNLFSSTFLQIYGGWFVVKTINDNLGILSGISIRQSMREYFLSIPKYKPKPITIQVNAGVLATGSMNAKVVVNRKIDTLEEKVEFLLDEVKRLENEKSQLKAEFGKIIGSLRSFLEDSIRDPKYDIEKIQDNLRQTLVGGAKEEALGMSCIFYSLLIPYVTHLVLYLVRP